MTPKINKVYINVGNVVYILCLVNGLAYEAMVVMFGDANHPQARYWFDDSWLSYGFCVTNAHVPFWSTHDLCLYADILLAAAVGIIYLIFRNRGSEQQLQKMQQANDLMKWQAFGVLGHGLAHGSIAYKLRLLSPEELFDQQKASQMEIILHSLKQSENNNDLFRILAPPLLVIVFFWLPIMKGAIPQSANWKVLFLTLLVAVGGSVVRQQHGFSYVQTVLTIVFSYNQFFGKTSMEKSSLTYPAFAFIGIPLGILVWIEAMACKSSGYMAFGGHVLYDVSIPFCTIAAYLTCYFTFLTENEDKKKDGSKSIKVKTM